MSIPLEQQEVARFLRSLSGGEPKETHISAVFIGKDTVWKLKKAVRLPFLDFTSVGARRHFLQRELTLNQPAAPEIYRDVAAVVRRSDGSLDLSADAEGTSALDWVFRMAPVPEQDFLDVMAGCGELTPAIQDALGDCVAHYHAGLRPVPAWDSLGLCSRVEGNARSAIVAGLARDAGSDWLGQIKGSAATSGGLAWERVVAGFVRRCHGDLHLGNLCLWQGTPSPSMRWNSMKSWRQSTWATTSPSC